MQNSNPIHLLRSQLYQQLCDQPWYELWRLAFQLPDISPLPVTCQRDDISLQVLRWFEQDALLSGNKMQKLVLNVVKARSLGAWHLVSMGGAYSNHLHALGALAKRLRFKLTVFIRGERPRCFSPTLQDLQRYGAQLIFISRTEYRELRQSSARLLERYGLSGSSYYWIPEGGHNHLGRLALAKWASQLACQTHFDYWVLPVGSAATLLGCMEGVAWAKQPVDCRPSIIAVPVFAGEVTFTAVMMDLQQRYPEWIPSVELWKDYHWGGFAKYPQALAHQHELMESVWGLSLDRVYTVKSAHALWEQLAAGCLTTQYKKPVEILFFHTGGLQGNRS